MNVEKVRNANFLEFDIQNKKLYVVKDHATALITWKKAYDDSLINKDALLFHIDQHTDFCFDEKNKEQSEKILEMRDEELVDFVINNLHPNNDEFIVNAMISGLIKDGISIYFSDGTNFGEFVKGHYNTTNKQKFECNGIGHNFYLCDTEDISNLVGYQCLIGDSLIHQDVNGLFQKNENLILDIDLDFFTYSFNHIYPRHPKDIKRQITSHSFKEIFEKSNIISIALEPDVCGGIESCLEILHVLNQHWLIPNKLDIFDITKSFLK